MSDEQLAEALDEKAYMQFIADDEVGAALLYKAAARIRELSRERAST